MPEREVYQQIANGDEAGWERLYEHKSGFHRMVTSRGGTREDAEDLQQEAFIELFTHKDTLDTSLNPDAYLGRVVRNKHIDLLRRQQVRPQQVNLPTNPETAEHLINNEFFVDRGPSVEDQVELKTDIEQSLQQMPPEQAEVLLYAAKGFTHLETAKELDIPLGTLKTRMRLGRAKMH